MRWIASLSLLLLPVGGVFAAGDPLQTNPAPENSPAVLQAQVQALIAANTRLQLKLNEALSVQPAAISPGELARAADQNLQLERSNALLAVTVQQLQGAAGAYVRSQETISNLQSRLEDTVKKLADTSAALSQIRTVSPESEKVKQLAAERDRCQQELAVVKLQLADLQTPPAKTSADTDGEIERLHARLAVLEAAPVPYTAEELAVLAAAPPSRPASQTVFVSATKRVVHSAKDLPAGVGPLMEEARRAAMEKDFALAEKKYQEVLVQAPDNIFVIVKLGDVQFDLNHLADSETNAQRALAMDPDDPDALYLLGLLRYRQEKLDEALDALSRSSTLNATNANTQYALGRVLSDKGMMAPAETAFRKSLQLAPDYADAHYNLAVVYAAEKPPSKALAQWHYQKSLDLGHPKNPSLETTLAGDK